MDISLFIWCSDEPIAGDPIDEMRVQVKFRPRAEGVPISVTETWMKTGNIFAAACAPICHWSRSQKTDFETSLPRLIDRLANKPDTVIYVSPVRVDSAHKSRARFEILE